MTQDAQWRLIMGLEGPVTDPAPGLVASLRWALAQAGHEVAAEADLTWMLDADLDDVLRQLLGGRHAELGPVVTRHFRRRYDEQGRFEGHVHAGMRQMLDALAHRRDVETVLVAAWPSAEVSRQLASHRMTGLFDIAACTTDRGCAGCRRQRAIDVAAWRPRTLWLTDDPEDIAAAHRHRIMSVAALWGRCTAEELAVADPALWAEKPADLTALLPRPATVRNGSGRTH